MGITDDATDSGITIYPNPTSDRINLSFKEIERDVTIRIYNPLGELIHTSVLNATQSFDFVMPNAAGIYLIQVTNENGLLQNFKVVKG